MLSPDSATDTQKQHCQCAVHAFQHSCQAGGCSTRSVGRPAGSHRHSALHNRAMLSPCTAPVTRHGTNRKPAVRRIRPPSTLQKHAQSDSLMMMLSDHSYLAKPSHRRSSLPMDYRWLAGMTPKWYANVKKRRSATKQQESRNMENKSEAADVDNKVILRNVTDMSQSLPHELAGRVESSTTESPSTLLAMLRPVNMCKVASVRSCQYSTEKFACSGQEALLKPFGELTDRSCVLDSDLSDQFIMLQAPVSVTKGSETVVLIQEDRETETAQQCVDKSSMYRVRHCDVDRPEQVTDDGTPVPSDMRVVSYKGAVCCSSTCDCFGFCDSDSLSTECETNAAHKNKMDVDGLVRFAGYIGCDGSHKVTCDLHLVGALETASGSAECAPSVTDGQLASAASSNEHEDFVDNICVDCGCELTCDSMAECVYSVPICSICLQDANYNELSVDNIASADHSYARLSTDHLACPSPLKETPSSSSATCQHPVMPDIDVVDDITFLSFPSKLLMHKYISHQQSVCDPAVKGSWTELARCERTWHGGHKSHRSIWFGSTRHRHIDRFSAHNRLNEQIELGLVKPVSAQNSTDFLGIKLKTSVAQNNTKKTVLARKFKCRNRHVPSDSRIQRPTRVAARSQHYCFTRYRRKNSASRITEGAERVDIMQVTQRQAEEALKLLNVPAIITRNNCTLPGIFLLSLNVVKYNKLL